MNIDWPSNTTMGSPAFQMADALVGKRVAHGAPKIWAHMWFEVYRATNGERHRLAHDGLLTVLALQRDASKQDSTAGGNS